MNKRSIALVLCASVLIAGCTAMERREIPPIDLKKMEMDNFPYKFSMDRIKEYTNEISKENTFRIQGSDEEKRVVDYIRDTLRNAGADVKELNYTIDNAMVDYVGIVTARPSNEIFRSVPVEYSPSTKEGGITCPVVGFQTGTDGQNSSVPSSSAVSNTEKVDYKGRLVIIPINEGEDITSKVNQAAEGGAEGVLVYTVGSGIEIPSVRSTPGIRIPVRVLSEKDAVMLERVGESNEGFSIFLESRSEARTIEGRNLMVTLKADGSVAGTSAASNTSAPSTSQGNIIITAYTDSPADPGANSDAVGIASIMDMYQVLKSTPLKADIHFVILSAAEIRNGGTESFIKSLDPEIIKNNIATINIDSFGRETAVTLAMEDQGIQDTMKKILTDAGIEKYNIKPYGDSVSRKLFEGGLKSVGYEAEEDLIKNTISDKPWTVDYSKVYANVMNLYKMIDASAVKKD